LKSFFYYKREREREFEFTPKLGIDFRPLHGKMGYAQRYQPQADSRRFFGSWEYYYILQKKKQLVCLIGKKFA
jgi:hypothetical protein